MSESRPIGIGFRKEPDTPRPGPTVRARVTHVDGGAGRLRTEHLVTEEPCEIIVFHRGAQHTVTVTMRTPGNDFELATGFLYTEGLIAGRGDIATVSYCKAGPPEQLYNQVAVELTDAAAFDPSRMQRHFATNSSCGVCGKASLEDVHVRGVEPLPDGPDVDASLITRLPELLLAEQRTFERTGGLHAAAVVTTDGTVEVVREDVGRHNAVDKAIGALLLKGALPARDRILQVSGRASFEIVQKALVAGIPIVSAVSAPSSLALQLAEEFSMTLAGFVRGDSFNVYCGSSRIRLTSSSDSGVSTSRSESTPTP